MSDDRMRVAFVVSVLCTVPAAIDAAELDELARKLERSACETMGEDCEAVSANAEFETVEISR